MRNKNTWTFLTLILMLNAADLSAQDQVKSRHMMVRIAEIEVHPEYLEDYKNILKDEAAASIKKEHGVIAIFPMFQQSDSTQIRIIEIYASKKAYELHLQTLHFKHYKSSTQKMVRKLSLMDMEALDKQTMVEIFRKMK